MKQTHGRLCVWACLVALGAVVLGTEPLPEQEKDGYLDVSKASEFVRLNDLAGGEAHLSRLRARPRDTLTPLELQAEDMAEFALYRCEATSNEVRRARCLDLLKKVQAADPNSIWGWAAYGFLDDWGATNGTVKARFDPQYHLGDIVDGVIDFEPRRLEPSGADTTGRAAQLLAAEASLLPAGVPTDDELAPGSPARRAILHAELVHLCKAETIDRLLAMKDGEALFNRIWQDDATLEAFLLSGLIFEPAQALELLLTFYLNDPDGWTATEEGRKITVASALNVRSQGKALDAQPEVVFLNRLRCWAAYRRLSQRQRFHESTAKRDAREWRFIVRDPTDACSILYLNSRPFNYERPGRMIGFVPYRFYNAFGDYIHTRGTRYWDHWRFSDWPYWYKVHRVGGICNRQSTFAAVCANAHGLMSQRAGQPGHCCWLLRDEKGVWTIRNDITKYTAGVYVYWGKGYQYIQATERAFRDRAAWERSELLRFRGALEAAIAACPYNLSAWQQRTARMKADKAPVAAWRAYLQELVARCPEGRTCTWDLAFEALAQLRAGGVTDEALFQDLAALFAALPEPKTQLPEEMDFRTLVMRRATGLFPKDKARIEEVLFAALAANWGTPHNFTAVLRHGLDVYAKNPAACNRFLSRFADEAARRGGDLKGKALDFRPLMEGASAHRQRDAFQTLAQLRDRLVPPPKGTAYPTNDFGATKLVSAKGLVYTSARGPGDRPEDYARTIDASPLPRKRTYQISLKAGDPWAAVELPGRCTLAGIRVLGSQLRAATVSVSEDGKQWSTLHTSAPEPMDEVRVDCTEKVPTAKYVRIGRVKTASSEPLRLGKILVYGETLY